MSLFGEPAEPSLETRRFAEEIADRKRELDLKEREVAAKEREVLAKEEELKRSRWTSPTVLGLFAATVGLLSSMLVAHLNNSNMQEVQRLQSEGNITLEAIKTGIGNTDASCKNLQFLVSLGLVRDPEVKIGKTCKGAPTGPPSLPIGQISDLTPSHFLVFRGKVVDDATGKGISGATVSVSPAGEPLYLADRFVATCGYDGSFALALPPSWEPDRLFLHVKSDGYSETTVEVSANQNASMTLHKAP
jgi:hypothetical protein